MKLVFVYNAKSDRLSKMFDFAHKIVRPSTYACDLCSLTHGNFGEKEEWSLFMKETNHSFDFHHIEDFEKKYNQTTDYPVIFLVSNDGLETLMSPEEISAIPDVISLISELKKVDHGK